MSTKSCLVLLLLACSFLSACSAGRRLGGVPVENRFHNFFPKKNNGDEKGMNKGPSVAAKGSKAMQQKVRRKGEKQVSWRVPHRKRGEKNPGFNSDYSPPKTHPPSHN